MKDVKFVRKDFRIIKLTDFIEDGEKYYIVLGKPSKLEQGIAFSMIGDVSILNDIKNKKVVDEKVIEKLDVKKIAETNYSNIAIHIYETNLTDNYESYDDRYNFVKELDRKCPELIDFLTGEVNKIDGEEEVETKKVKK